jgi:hypothetical protein
MNMIRERSLLTESLVAKQRKYLINFRQVETFQEPSRKRDLTRDQNIIIIVIIIN